MRVESDPPQSFSAGFELSGDATEGVLTLYTPLGTTLAALSWNASGSTLQRGAERSQYSSLPELMRQTLGAELPVPALFGWLAGRPGDAPGWQADLSQRPQGRIRARRHDPAPAAELRLQLEP